MSQTQNYLKWKQKQDVSTERISKETSFDSPQEPSELKEVFKYRKHSLRQKCGLQVPDAKRERTSS